MLTLQQWKEYNKEYYKPGEFNEETPVSSVKFIQKINKPDVVFVKEDNTRYVMYKSLTDAVRQNSRITNIDVDPDKREVSYEGRESKRHCVVGDDADYDVILSILNNRVVDTSTTHADIHDSRTKWYPDRSLAKKFADKYNTTVSDYFSRAQVENIEYEGSMMELAKDAGFPVRSGNSFYSSDKQHKIQIHGWSGNYNMNVYSLNNPTTSNYDNHSIYDELNQIDDDMSL